MRSVRHGLKPKWMLLIRQQEAIETLTSRSECRWGDSPHRMISHGQLHFWRIPRKAGSSTGTPLLSTEAGLPTEAGKRYVSAIANAQRRISGFSLLLLAFYIGDEVLHEKELWGRPIWMDFFLFQSLAIRRYREAVGLSEQL